MTTHNKKDIWCCCCGDRTCYATSEDRSIKWVKIDEFQGVGICKPCAKNMTPKELESVFKEARCAPQDD